MQGKDKDKDKRKIIMNSKIIIKRTSLLYAGASLAVTRSLSSFFPPGSFFIFFSSLVLISVSFIPFFEFSLTVALGILSNDSIVGGSLLLFSAHLVIKVVMITDLYFLQTLKQ